MSAPAVINLLDERLRRSIVEKRWKGLSRIQEAAFLPIFSGEDCVIEAPTAGGKTEAVFFPLITRVAQGPARDGVRVLYLAPLRALLNNLEKRVEGYAEACGLEAFKWHGDVSQADKIEAFARPPQVLITTPESVEAMLLRKSTWRAFFGDLVAIVVDEAHSFAFGDRGGHLLSLLERIEEATASPPQRIAVTATVGNPDEMLRWLAGCRSPGRRIHVSGDPPARDFQLRLFNEDLDDDDTAPRERSNDRLFEALTELLPRKKSIVFVPSRKRAEALAKTIVEAGARSQGRRISVQTHHSSVSRFFREEAERLIQVAGESGIDAIISTSTLELGIDIGELDWVVQVGALTSPSAFLQRVGRTGRREGRPQQFRGLCTDPDDLPIVAAVINLGLQRRAEPIPFPRRAYHLLAHQLICLSLQSHGVDPGVAWSRLSPAHCFSAILREDFDRLVEHMIEHGFLRDADGLLIAGEETERVFLAANWRKLFAVFDSAPMYEVHEHKAQVGTLDAGFVEALEPPFHFVLAGRLWLAKSVDAKARVVAAERSDDANAPKWTSFGGPGVPFETAQEAGRMLHAETIPDYLDEEAAASFRACQSRMSGDGWSPSRMVITAWPGGQGSIVTFAGDRINRTLAKLLIAERVGRATADYREVLLRGGDPSAPELRARVLSVIDTLRAGGSSAAVDLQERLVPHLPLWPFSPFARCLPGELWAAALAERTLDVEGLSRFVAEHEVC